MLAGALLVALTAAGPVAATGSPALAVRHDGRWIAWWSAAEAPRAWREADRRVTDAVRWRDGAAGMAIGELTLAGSGLAWRVRVIVVRFDPSRLELRLAHKPDRLNRPDRWDVDDAMPEAVLAMNAGQFDGRGPWGWMVQDGVERRPPGRGPLAPAIVQDRRGRLRLVPAEAIDSVRAAGGVRFAIQSFPAVLLGDGEVPAPLRVAGSGVNLTHRDARVALCERRDGSWLAMLTRYEGLGGVLEALPIGLTTPEMGALAGALGCARAVLLDGGMSGQLLVRDRDGVASTWRGLRRVPAGLVAVPLGDTGGR